jgi:hypothetical protein
MASEMGVLPVDESTIVSKWRLQPGKMLLIDMEEGRIISDEEVKSRLAAKDPYREWLERTQLILEGSQAGRAGRCARTSRCSTASRRSAIPRKTPRS